MKQFCKIRRKKKSISGFQLSSYYFSVLFADGRTICFGLGDSGQLGHDDSTAISGPTGPALATQSRISFQDNSIPITQVAAMAFYTCVVRSDRKVVCFGSNADGAIGIGQSVSVYGTIPGNMGSLAPIGFNPAKVSDATAALTSLVLSSNYAVPVSASQTFFNIWVVGASEISIVRYAVAPASASIVVNQGLTVFDYPIALKAGAVNHITIVVLNNGSTPTTYLLAVRSLAAASVIAGPTHACLLATARLVCWGV
jgi:hypothetical protein